VPDQNERCRRSSAESMSSEAGYVQGNAPPRVPLGRQKTRSYEYGVDGLKDWLRSVGLEHKLQAAHHWCCENGAAFLEEVKGEVKSLADAIDLTDEERASLLASCQGTHAPLRTVSVGCGSPDAATNMWKAYKITATVKAARDKLKVTRTTSPGMEAMQPVKEVEETSDLGRTATVTVDGPFSGLISSLPIKHKELSVCQFHRSQVHTGALPETPKQPQPHQGASPAGGASPLQRLSTVAGLGAADPENDLSRRSKLLDQIKEEHATPTTLDEGQTGMVYALEAGGHKIAVFKPKSGEGFSRKYLDAGSGYVREEAVYLVDRLCGSKAGVPVTSRASIEVDGAELSGSVQAFVEDVLGFIEDFGMPRSAEDASKVISQETAEALALLDMRVFNMDRHPGNLLVLNNGSTSDGKPRLLGPIDHGCCLPPWWSLGEAIFDAWSSWPQLQVPPSQASIDLLRSSKEKLDQTCHMTSEIGLEASAVLTLRLCTLFVFVGVVELGLPVGKLAVLMLKEYNELTWLEARVLACAKEAGADCWMEVTDSGYEELEVKNQGEGLQEEAFLAALEKRFREELPSAIKS